MHVSMRSVYALRALRLLGREAGVSPLKTADMASAASIPEKYLEGILVSLRKAGLVQSRRGPDGGHVLARTPSTIRVTQVLEAIEGPLRVGDEHGPASGDPALDACLRDLWRQAEEAVHKTLEPVTIQDLIERTETLTNINDFHI